MQELFPTNVRLSQIRGITKILNEFSGPVEISRLSSEANEEVDDLLPVINASRMLGLLKLSDGNVKLTKAGQSLTRTTSITLIKNKLKRIEPFKTTLSIARPGESITTTELIKQLESRGFLTYRGDIGRHDFVQLLLNFAVRCDLLEYDRDKSAWELKKKA